MGKRLEVKPGDRYGRLTVVEEVEPYRSNGQMRRRFLCKCDCGDTKEIRLGSLRSGDATSCGCVHRGIAAELCRNRAKPIHGMIQTPTYFSWGSMIQRCVNPNNNFYARYGGRGIAVCERWRSSFKAFLEDMGEKPDGLTLDRIDNDGDYKPGNCRWTTPKEQQRHRRLMLTIHGDTASVEAWATRVGINRHTLTDRIKRGMPPEEAISLPLYARRTRP